MRQGRRVRRHASEVYEARFARRAALVSLAVAGLLGLGGLVAEEALRAATRDPLAVARAGGDVFKPWIGWLSHLGILGWGLGAAALLVAAEVQRRARRTAEARFLLAVGALTALLMLDDLLLLHESVVPRYAGGSQEAALVVWALLGVALCWVFRGRLLDEPDLPLLALAVGWFGVSVGLEVVALGGYFEDAAKLLGIGVWATALVRIALRALTAGQGRFFDAAPPRARAPVAEAVADSR